MAAPSHVISGKMSAEDQVEYLLEHIFGPGDGVNTKMLLFGGGTAADPVTTELPDRNFIEYRWENTATSGDNRGAYLRLYLSGAAGGGECLRVFTTVNDVAAGTAHGAHISLNFADTGSITGLGVAGRNTLHVPNAALSGGTYAAVQAEIYADGASSDISGATKYSFFRVVMDGNATGKGNVEDNAVLFSFAGGSVASGNIVRAKSSAAVSHIIPIDCYGTTYYLMVSNAA